MRGGEETHGGRRATLLVRCNEQVLVSMETAESTRTAQRNYELVGGPCYHVSWIAPDPPDDPHGGREGGLCGSFQPAERSLARPTFRIQQFNSDDCLSCPSSLD